MTGHNDRGTRQDGGAIKSGKEIERNLRDCILHIYLRPLMYAGSPRDLETMLDVYHENWAFCLDRHEEYWECRRQFDKGKGAASIPFYKEAVRKFPHADQFQIAEFVVNRFVAIDRELKIPLPFEDFRGNVPWLKDPSHPIAKRFTDLMSQWEGKSED